MAYTANYVINRAASKINVLAGGEALSATDAANCLNIMNDMMFAFRPKGIHYVHSALTATQTVNMPDEQINNLILMLANDLADEYGITLGQKIANDIAQAKLELQAAYLHINPAVPDRALRVRRPGFYDFARGSNAQSDSRRFNPRAHSRDSPVGGSGQ